MSVITDTCMGGLTKEYSVREQTVQLEKLQLRRAITLSKMDFCARDAQMHIFESDFGSKIVMELNAYIAAQKVAEKEVTVSVSIKRWDTWWDMFKETYFPDWLLERFPANFITKTETKTEKFNAYVCYPDIVIPNQRNFMIWRDF